MAYSVDSIVFIPDLSRLARPGERAYHSQNRESWNLNAEILYHCCRVPAAHGTGLSPHLLDERTLPDFSAAFYSCLGVAGRQPDFADWTASLRQDPNDALRNLFKHHFAGCFVVGLALPPLFKKTLSDLAIPWLDVVLHPARYLDNLLYACSSNVPAVNAFLAEARLAPRVFEAKAAQEIARCARNNSYLYYWLPDPTLLILGQTADDPLPLGPDGRVLSFLDFRDELTELCAAYQRVFFMQPDASAEAAPSGEELALFESLGVIRLPAENYTFRNHYMLLAHPCATRVAGLNTGALTEAIQFGKECTAFAPSREPLAAPYQPIYDKFFTAAFWHALMARFTPPKAEPPPSIEYEPIPNLRLALRGGGSDFDDTGSISNSAQIGKLAWEVRELQKHTFVQELFKPAADAVDAPAPAYAPEPRAPGPEPWAVFAAGDGNVVAQSIVALKSFARRGVADALFYVADERAIPQDKKDLLRHCGVELLHTEYAEQFRMHFLPHSTHAAYNQFAGPGLLRDRGFAHSIGIQCDVLCVRPFAPETIFADTRCIAATNNSTEKNAVSYADPRAVCRRYGIPEPRMDALLMNPGVLFINNKGFLAADIPGQILDIYRDIGPDAVLYGEESMLNILFMRDPDLCRMIDPAYNTLIVHPFGPSKPYCIHFNISAAKPWTVQKNARQLLAAPIKNTLVKLWRAEAERILGPDLYREHIGSKLVF